MEITYFNRNPKAGFSIAKVFNTLKPEIEKTFLIKEYDLPYRRADPYSVFMNICFIFKNRNKNGINHITGEVHYGLIGLIGCKSVLTVHDLSSLDCLKNPIKRFLMKWLWFKIPVFLADKVVCISEHTESELKKLTKRKDILVIHNAVDPMFTFVPKKFNETKPVILQVGTSWNKNLINTIKALQNLVVKLVIVGKVSNEILSLLKDSNCDYVLKSNLTDLELLNEYINCDIVNFCSIYEGFGMPIIEGNATGRCVLTSLISPLTEIAADAACFVNPNNISEMTNKFKEIILNSDFRNQLISNGLLNINRFKVKDAAKSYISLYQSILSQ